MPAFNRGLSMSFTTCLIVMIGGAFGTLGNLVIFWDFFLSRATDFCSTNVILPQFILRLCEVEFRAIMQYSSSN